LIHVDTHRSAAVWTA